MDLPPLWALDLSPQAQRLLRLLQGPNAELTTQQQRLHDAAATLRDALVHGLNELARREGLGTLDAAAERGLEGTHLTPVITNRS